MWFHDGSKQLQRNHVDLRREQHQQTQNTINMKFLLLRTKDEFFL